MLNKKDPFVNIIGECCIIQYIRITKHPPQVISANRISLFSKRQLHYTTHSFSCKISPKRIYYVPGTVKLGADLSSVKKGSSVGQSWKSEVKFLLNLKPPVEAWCWDRGTFKQYSSELVLGNIGKHIEMDLSADNFLLRRPDPSATGSRLNFSADRGEKGIKRIADDPSRPKWPADKLTCGWS